MPANNQTETDIDIPTPATTLLGGYRLDDFEVLNWGTYSKPYIAKISLNGESALLTGKNGSGKSTLCDGLITLLVPYQKITYNKAAGVEMRGRKAERSALSYIRGEYRNEKSDVDGSSKPVYLRGENDYSVLLAYFHNAVLNEGFTLVQVYWLRNEKVEKRFIFSHEKLTIKDHFIGFGPDILVLIKKLRAHPQTMVYDTFAEY